MTFTIVGKPENLVLPDGKYKVTGIFTIGPYGIKRIDDSTWTLIKEEEQ